MEIFNLDSMIVRLKKEVEHTLTDVVLKSNLDEENIRKALKETHSIIFYTDDSIEIDGVVEIAPNTVSGIVVPFTAQVKFMLSIDKETQNADIHTAFGLCSIGMKNQPQTMIDVDELHVSSYSLSDFIE